MRGRSSQHRIARPFARGIVREDAIDGRSPRSLGLVGPLAADELAMPAEQGGRRDDQV
jgi:hypothetical protein